MNDHQTLTVLRTQDYDTLDLIVKDIVAGHEKDIARIDEEIEQFRRYVRQLEFQKLQHEELIRQCKGMTTFARRLPPEILVSIFEMCVNDGWTLTPLLVSHVCSEWRKAASNPSVWSHVYVDCDSARDPYSKTKLWLDKAHDSLLRVTIEARTNGTRLSRVMMLLAARSSRWRSLSIICSSDLHLMQLLSFCKQPSPSLQFAYISVEHGLDNTVNLHGNDVLATVPLDLAFPDAPHLRLVRLRRSMLPTPDFFPSTVTRLYLDLFAGQSTGVHVFAGSIIDLLRNLLQLHTFSLSMPGSGLSIEELNDANTAVLPNLHRLVLSGPPGLFELLLYLRTPVLTRLHLISPLEFIHYAHDITGVHLRHFVVVSRPPLQLLELRDVVISSEAYLHVFAYLPDLQELRLHESEITNHVLQQLEGQFGLCPHLRVLDLRWCNQVSGSALVGLVKSRLPSRNDLENKVDFISAITVINCAFVGDQDIIKLAEMTVCCLIILDEDDQCRFVGCCNNARYRRRIELLTRHLQQDKHFRLVL